MISDRNTMFKGAALLRERILNCLRAAPAPMAPKELHEWPSIAEQVGPRGYHKVTTQITNMRARGEIERIGSGRGAAYRYVEERVIAPPQEATESELHLQVDRAKRTIAFRFAGMKFTVEVLS